MEIKTLEFMIRHINNRIDINTAQCERTGLCRLAANKSKKCRDEMVSRLRLETNDPYSFVWPLTDKGDVQRIRFLQEWVKKLSSQSG